MQRYSSTAQRRQTRGIATSRPARNIQPGDKVMIFDGLISQNIWIIVDDVLISGGRTKLRSGNMDFYFDASLVIAHQKGVSK